MHCKVLIADICKLRLQPLQTSDNHSPHASHFRSWSLFFSAQCCFCPKTLSAAAYREVWVHSNQQHNGPMCWHLASCESRAWQKGQNTHCGKQTSHIYNCNTKHIQWERCSKTPVFDCSARTRASGVLFWQSITSHRWGLNKHRVVLFGLDSRPAATWLLRKTRHTWMIWSINLNGLTNDTPLVEVKNSDVLWLLFLEHLSFACLRCYPGLVVMPPPWGFLWLACGKCRQFLRIFPIPEPQPLVKLLWWCLSYLELRSCIADVFDKSVDATSESSKMSFVIFYILYSSICGSVGQPDMAGSLWPMNSTTGVSPPPYRPERT